MTARSTLGPGDSSDLPGDARDLGLGGVGIGRDAVPAVHESQQGLDGDRLVYRPTATLRPHPTYQEVCGPITAARVSRVAQQAGAIRESLLTTTDGTILDRHARWQVATERQQPILPCIEYNVTAEEALQFVIQRHRTSEGLNDFCRIVLALRLEAYFREGTRRPQCGASSKRSPSSLTNVGRRDVRANIAHAAGVSTGNVTKVKQLLDSVIPAIRERLLRGEVSIHRAWQWRHLSAKQQREVLWEHQHRKGIRQTIRHLITQHTRSQRVVPTVDQVRVALGGVATHETAVVVADIPGNAIVVTRECYEELVGRRTNGPKEHATP